MFTNHPKKTSSNRDDTAFVESIHGLDKIQYYTDLIIEQESLIEQEHQRRIRIEESLMSATALLSTAQITLAKETKQHTQLKADVAQLERQYARLQRVLDEQDLALKDAQQNVMAQTTSHTNYSTKIGILRKTMDQHVADAVNTQVMASKKTRELELQALTRERESVAAQLAAEQKISKSLLAKEKSLNTTLTRLSQEEKQLNLALTAANEQLQRIKTSAPGIPSTTPVVNAGFFKTAAQSNPSSLDTDYTPS